MARSLAWRRGEALLGEYNKQIRKCHEHTQALDFATGGYTSCSECFIGPDNCAVASPAQDLREELLKEAESLSDTEEGKG